MQYVTAAEAGRRIGVSEKTVRLWIQKGNLSAHVRTKNRLAIPLPEVERIARERKQYEPEANQAADLAGQVAQLREEIEARPADLESRIEAVEQRLARIESAIFRDQARPVIVASEPGPAAPPVIPAGATRQRKQKAPELPPGHIMARDFALAHGVNPNTFRDHYIKGIGRGEVKERVPTESRPKPGREEKEREYFLSPEQQDQARDFWTRHGVNWHYPEESGQDRDFTDSSEENDALE